MDARSISFQPPKLCSLQALLLCCTAMAVGAGCARGIYQVHKLPAEFLAPPVENVKTIDISTLATQVTNTRLIDRGDILDVSIATGYSDGKNPPASIRVAEDGTATVPLVGKVMIADMVPEAAEQAIAAAGVERGVYRNPYVTLVMKRQRVNRITVIGAVLKPGIHELPRSSSGLLAAIVAAGGLSPEAGTEIEVRRPGSIENAVEEELGPVTPVAYSEVESTSKAIPSTRVNLLEAAATGTGGKYLQDGDVVMVAKRDPLPFQVIGLVKKPGQYNMPIGKEIRVLDALAIAGGWTSVVADRVHVIRTIPGRSEPVVIQVSLREAKVQGQGNLRLAPGDVVSVEQTPATTIVDTVSQFARVSFGGSFRFY